MFRTPLFSPVAACVAAIAGHSSIVAAASDCTCTHSSVASGGYCTSNAHETIEFGPGQKLGGRFG